MLAQAAEGVFLRGAFESFQNFVGRKGHDLIGR
jgi:hypothetical protein